MSIFIPLLQDSVGKGIMFFPFYSCLFVRTDTVTMISHERFEQF